MRSTVMLKAIRWLMAGQELDPEAVEIIEEIDEYIEQDEQEMAHEQGRAAERRRNQA